MLIISNKSFNYPFAGSVFLVIFLLSFWLGSMVGIHNKLFTILCFLSGIIIAFGHTTRVPILKKGLLLFNGEEVRISKDKSVWLSPGMYFTFFLFSISLKELQDMEERDVIVPPFRCQDSNFKNLAAEANGDWEIVEHDKFKKQKEKKMKSNLSSLIKRSIIRICGGLEYGRDILTGNVSKLVLADPIFKEECERYGISFYNLIIEVISANLEQDDLNAYMDQLDKKARKNYPLGHPFTHEENQDIQANLQVQLKIARRIITNSAIVGRYDIDDKGGKP
ncbi:hypothetical protein HXX01_04845 [Candidatus Nomurabacteria bacterium]|nr:hypothetical protein [Candidatus Nomurabacteria bacterium]